MSSILVVDRLHDTEVVATLAILPAKPDQTRDERKVVLTLGIPDKEVVMRSGTLADVQTLLDDAWTAYAQVATVSDESDGEDLASIPAEPAASGSDFYSDDDF